MIKGHFQIKSPDNHVGIVIVNKDSNVSYCDLLEMGIGDFVCCPNDPYYFQWGKYTTVNSDPVLAAIYIVGNDAYAKDLRRNLMTYDIVRDSSSTKITIWASFDGGAMVNGTGSPDDVIFRGVTISGQSLPKIPDKIKIGEILFKKLVPVPTSVPTKPNPQTTYAKTTRMQETGLPIAALILAVLMMFGGLVTSKRK